MLRSAAGDEDNVVKTNALNAVAVRNIDVAASAPEPQTLALAQATFGETTVVVGKRRQC